jgi:hypothetical protein
VPVGGTARTAIVRYIGQRGTGAPDEPLFLGRRGALDWWGMQQVLNGDDVFSLQRILGHTTLDMVKRYVALADVDLVARHRVASPADRLIGVRSR